MSSVAGTARSTTVRISGSWFVARCRLGDGRPCPGHGLLERHFQPLAVGDVPDHGQHSSCGAGVAGNRHGVDLDGPALAPERSRPDVDRAGLAAGGQGDRLDALVAIRGVHQRVELLAQQLSRFRRAKQAGGHAVGGQDGAFGRQPDHRCRQRVDGCAQTCLARVDRGEIAMAAAAFRGQLDALLHLPHPVALVGDELVGVAGERAERRFGCRGVVEQDGRQRQAPQLVQCLQDVERRLALVHHDSRARAAVGHGGGHVGHGDDLDGGVDGREDACLLDVAREPDANRGGRRHLPVHDAERLAAGGLEGKRFGRADGAEGRGLHVGSGIGDRRVHRGRRWAGLRRRGRGLCPPAASGLTPRSPWAAA